MAQRRKIQTVDRFTYTPGDGHRYALRGDVIVVEQIIQPGTSGMWFRPTGDTFRAPASRTATALMDAVDQWRWVQPYPCDECGAMIPGTESDGINDHHEDSCSLHPSAS